MVKAYDTVNRDLLWIILEKNGIPNSLVIILKKLYNNTTISFNIEKKEKTFNSTCGVKQGDNLAPILFVIFIDAVIKTLDTKWDFQTPDFRWLPDTKTTGKKRGSLSNINWKNKGTKFSFYQSFYVDDAAFILLNRTEAQAAIRLITSHFKRFGLTVHTGDRNKEDKSKTEFVFIPAPTHSPTPSDTADINIDDNRFISSCDKFQYLGTQITSTLKCDTDINNRIKKAQFLFFALNKPVFRSKDISIDIRRRIYVAIIINTLLWGCESWPLTVANRRKLDVFHNRCCRRIMNLTIYDVMADHSFTNAYVRKETGILPLHSYLELRRARWLEKMSNMHSERIPRKLLGAWLPHARRNSTAGRPQQTIRHAYAETLRKLGFDNTNFQTWMEEAKDRNIWAKRIEHYLNLPAGSYSRNKYSLKSFSDLQNKNI